MPLWLVFFCWGLGFGVWDLGFSRDGIGVARFGAMSIDDLWYKNAVIYCLDVEKYQDANGDDGQHRITLEPYAWRWYRVGAPDNVLDRSDLAVGRHDAPTARDPGKS